MKTISLSFPDDLVFSLKMQEAEFGYEIKKLALVKLFELGKISSGKAAQILGITRIGFFDILTQYGVDVYNDVDGNSLKQDRQNA
jgi:predicted HTH domain antitoxin